jgi:hypothetical protein
MEKKGVSSLKHRKKAVAYVRSISEKRPNISLNTKSIIFQPISRQKRGKTTTGFSPFTTPYSPDKILL